jgi:hypothetical protein
VRLNRLTGISFTDLGGESGSISTVFPFQAKGFCIFQGTNPLIVSEVTFNPIDSGGQEEKNDGAGQSEPFYAVYGGKVKNAGKMLVLGMLGFLGAGLLLNGCKPALELTKANAQALIQAKDDLTPAAGVAIAVDEQGLKDGVSAKYWDRAKVYPNRYWGDFPLTPEGKKVLKLANGGNVLQWRPENDKDKNYAVVVTTVATNHLKAQDVQDVQDEALPGVETAKGADFTEAVNLDGLPAPLAKIAHNAVNKLTAKRHADFALENGVWKLHSVE